MGVLPNPKFERVAQELARLKTPEQASEIAGYDATASSFASNARKRACRSDIKARVAEIQGAEAALSGVDAAWIMAKAAVIGGVKLDPEDIKPNDVIAALNLLAKMTPGALAPTKGELTGKDGAPLIPEYTDEERARALEVWLARQKLIAKPETA